MSSRGVAFRTDETLPVGTVINLYISWPIALAGRTAIMLFAEGEVVRKEGRVAGVKISRHEFRTQKQ